MDIVNFLKQVCQRNFTPHLLFLLSTAWFSGGLGSSYNYDESVTVATFVELDSVVGTISTQNNFNNHLGTSVVSHALYRVGLGHPIAYRLVSVVLAAATVVLIYHVGVRLLSARAGLAAAFVVMLNPMFGELGGQVRGYAPMVFFLVAATWLLVDSVRQGVPVGANYSLAVALAMCFNLYAAVPLAIHGVVILVHRPVGWLSAARRLCIGGLLGLATYVGVLGLMVESSAERASVFRPDLPLDILVRILGDQLLAIPLLGACLLAGIALLARSSYARTALLSLAAVFSVIWFVLSPRDTYPRMWVWLIPGVALAIGFAVERFPRLLVVTAVGLVFVLIGSVPQVVRKDRSAAHVAEILLTAQRSGLEVCALGYSGEPLLAYIETTPITSIERAAECDVLIALPPFRDTIQLINTGPLFEIEDPMRLSMTIGWTDAANRSTPALANIVTSGETSASGIDS